MCLWQAARGHKASKHSFAFDITDTVGTHNVFIDVRHTGDYPYQDMYLFVDLEDPQGEHSAIPWT